MAEKPIGRRVALGVIGAGLAGIVFGARVQDAMERVLGPITARDGTGLSSFFPVGRFRIYSVVGRLPRRTEPSGVAARSRPGCPAFGRGFVERP